YIEEEMTNDADTDLEIMWGQHIASGLPFLEDGVAVETNARSFTTEPEMPGPGRFTPGVEHQWPYGEKWDGTRDRADLIEGTAGATYSELCYLKGMDKKAFYSVTNPVK